MERRINTKIDAYITKFKEGIRQNVTDSKIDKEQMIYLLQYIYDYERLVIDKNDLIKRKRVKNVVPSFDRCCAKRANGEQCTRRKKEDSPDYCGNHIKGTPHGIVNNNDLVKPTTQKVEVWAQDIKGIIYYIDKNDNVYQTEDIIMNKMNPKIIAKYTKTDNIYSIPEYGI